MRRLIGLLAAAVLLAASAAPVAAAKPQFALDMSGCTTASGITFTVSWSGRLPDTVYLSATAPTDTINSTYPESYPRPKGNVHSFVAVTTYAEWLQAYPNPQTFSSPDTIIYASVAIPHTLTVAFSPWLTYGSLPACP
jgi:hypothetical protein